jgi:hypothetical protein
LEQPLPDELDKFLGNLGHEGSQRT